MSDLKIRSVETVLVDLPMRRRQSFSATRAQFQTVIIIQLHCDDGVTGLGEAVTPAGPWWGGESPETIKLTIDRYLAPLLVGKDAFEINAIMAEMHREVQGNSFAKAGLEMALLDAQGKALSLPVHTLLGGRRRDDLRCSWPLATGDADLEIEEAERMLDERRFDTFKLKMGFLAVEEDVARACRIAAALAGRASVRVDPNEVWDETVSKRELPKLADAGVDMIEQPAPRWNLEACARLTAQGTMTVMIDEGVQTPQDMLRIAQLHAADLVSLKVMKSGGLRASRRIADIAEAGGVSLYMGTFLESSIGTAASLQLCATLPDLPYGGELCGPALLAEDLATEPAVYRDYRLAVPNAVGIGAEIDLDKLAAFRRDRSHAVHPMPERVPAGE